MNPLPTRVLVVTTIARTARSFLLDMLADLSEQGCAVRLVANTSDTEVVDELRERHDLDVVGMPWSRSPKDLGNLLALVRMRKMLQSADVAEVHTPIAAAVTRIAAASIPKARRPKLTYFAHGFHFQSASPVGMARVWFLIERALRTVTDQIFVINQFDKELAIGALGYNNSQVVPIAGVGIDLDHYLPKGGPVGAPRIAVVGNLDQGKRPLEVIEAVTAMKRPCPVTFAGAGPMAAAVESYAAELSVDIEMLGRVSDIRTVLDRCNVLVFLSEREGLPRSVLEAVAMGLPVVAHPIRGVIDILDGHPWWFKPDSRSAHDVARQIDAALASLDGRDADAMRESLRRFDSTAVSRTHTRELLKVQDDPADLRSSGLRQ